MTTVLSSQVTWIRMDIEENETRAIGQLEIVEVFSGFEKICIFSEFWEYNHLSSEIEGKNKKTV